VGNRPTKVPAVAAPINDTNKEIMRVVTNIAEAVDVRLGRRGDPLDRAVTVRELIDSGLAKKLVDRPFNPNNPLPDFEPPLTVVTARPPQPTGFSATPSLRTITLFWTQPTYLGHSFAEIWRFDTDTLGNAIMVGTATGISYIDYVGPNDSFYYWVRFVNNGNIPGDFNSTAGTLATTAPDVDLLVDLLGVPSGPIVEVTVPYTLNGVLVPTGTYIRDAWIQNGTISNAKIGLLAVDTANIANLSVSEAKIDNLAVSEAKIANLAVTDAKIQNLAVTEAKIANLAVTTAKIGDLQVDSIKITGNAVSQTAYAEAFSAASVSLTFTARNGTVMIWATFYPTGTTARWYYIKRGVTTIKSAYMSSVTSPVFMIADTPGSGSVTYTAECSVSANLIELQVLEVLK
jgi:hypothetical protein